MVLISITFSISFSAIPKGLWECEVNCSNELSSRSCTRQVSEFLFRSLPLDGGIEKCGRVFIGGLFFVVCSCGLTSGGTDGDCFGSHVGFGLSPERRECAGSPVVLGPLSGTGLALRGLTGNPRPYV